MTPSTNHSTCITLALIYMFFTLCCVFVWCVAVCSCHLRSLPWPWPPLLASFIFSCFHFSFFPLLFLVEVCVCVFIQYAVLTHFFCPSNPRVSFAVTRGQPQPLGVSELHRARSRKRLGRRECHSDPRHPLPVHTGLLRTCSHRPAVCQGNSSRLLSASQPTLMCSDKYGGYLKYQWLKYC